MLIEVTRDHIERGKADCRYMCPVVLALQDAGYAEVDVDAFEITYLRDDGVWTKIRTPEIAARFVHDFDDEDTRDFVLPFSFEL